MHLNLKNKRYASIILINKKEWEELRKTSSWWALKNQEPFFHNSTILLS